MESKFTPAFCFIQAPEQTGWGPLTPETPSADTSTSNVFTAAWATLSQSKLTHEIDHHTAHWGVVSIIIDATRVQKWVNYGARKFWECFLEGVELHPEETSWAAGRWKGIIAQQYVRCIFSRPLVLSKYSSHWTGKIMLVNRKSVWHGFMRGSNCLSCSQLQMTPELITSFLKGCEFNVCEVPMK